VKEISDLVRAWRRLPVGEEAVLATVVGTAGSTYRRAGARMLITRQEWMAGSISGGCLEGDVLQTAWRRTENGPAIATYDASADEDIVWGFGLGCNGIVRVLLERIPPDGGVLAYLEGLLHRREPGVLATVVSEGPRLGERWCLPWTEDTIRCRLVQEGEDAVLIEAFAPSSPLTVFGGGHDVIPVTRFAKALGWHVTVVDPRHAHPERFPDADIVVAETEVFPGGAAVVMTHNYLRDRDILRALLGGNAGYIGLLGPRRRAERILNDLRDDGFVPNEEQLARLHAPIGLDLGADGPDEIALAIVAEIQAFFARRSGGSLRGRTDALHEITAGLTANPAREAPRCGLSA